ncbi:MAG: alanyl-tRNA editing protein [Ectothiorhodospiraceae bacterium]|nr:alanyl-tRNA editing protein [Chromatiales bacterium]MCP5153498.1 alanyl-tRNA editing protein [Ectothiorhodospiraceae bacterium]
MADELFRADAYLKSCEATITAVDGNTIELDRTVFYPTGGGQPGDRGVLALRDGTRITVTDTRKGDGASAVIHVIDGQASPDWVGTTVDASIEWERRHRLMRVHTLLHLLCAVVPAGVTGGAIRDDGTGRLDFDLPESTLDKTEITDALNRLVREDHPVVPRWISEEELDRNPELVRTMSVAPPRGQGRIRVLEISDVDLQPCGGTHVSRTSEIGEVAVDKIEKKGKHNRRVNVRLLTP